MTQQQLSTGLAVENASDNASYWSIAQTMTSDNKALGAVSDSLKVSEQMVSTFNSALKQAMGVLTKIKADLTSAQNPGADLKQIQTDIAAQQSALQAIADSTVFNGQNWLKGDSTASSTTPGGYAVQKLVGGYVNGSTGVITISVDTKNTILYDANTTAASKTGILDKQGTASGAAIKDYDVTNLPTGKTIANLLQDLDTAYTALEKAGSTFGSATNMIETQQSYISTMQTNLDNGIASLVDADMNKVSTRLQALQTQQQLGVQSLSIANQSTQMILKLFQ
ncbi:flagellin [Rhodoblastus acidophilus]|nr:flagellin [Rhodoblastus acidophilus]MCW2332710.1 flagellin [Rhodoblastus acidophilus]